MRLGGYSRIGFLIALYCASFTVLSQALPETKPTVTPPYKPVDVKPGFPANDPMYKNPSRLSSIMQNIVSARESSFIAKASKAVAVGSEAGSLGIMLASATQIIKENPAVIDSYRMCGESVGNAHLCSASSVFEAARGYAMGKYGDAVSDGMSGFGNAMVDAGKTTWGMLGVSAGVYHAADLGIQAAGRKIEFIKEGVLKNGLYELQLSDGSTLLTAFKPSANSPVPVALTVGGNIFSANTIDEKQKTLNNSVEKPVPPATYFKTEAPPPISQPFPDDAFRVAVEGTAYPYSLSGADNEGDYYIVGNNPVSMAVYHKLLQLNKSNYVSYFERADDNKLTVRIPSIFHLYSVKVKDFQYSDINQYFGNYPTDINVVLSVTDISVSLDNSSEICSFQNISDGDKGTRRAYICQPEKARYRSIDNTKDERIFTIHLNTNYSFPKAPEVIGNVTELGKENQEALSPSALSSLINNLLNQAVSSADYRGIPVENPVTASEIANAANSAGIKLDKGLLFEPVSSPVVWGSPASKPSPDNHPHRDPDGDEDDYPDLGENPNTPAPELEEPPTGEEILKPITELMPFVKDIQISAKDVQCPKWEFELWDTSYSIDAHCTLLERIRTVLKIIFMLIWGLVSLRIILSA